MSEQTKTTKSELSKPQGHSQTPDSEAAVDTSALSLFFSAAQHSTPPPLRPSVVQALQRTHGNHFTAQFVHRAQAARLPSGILQREDGDEDDNHAENNVVEEIDPSIYVTAYLKGEAIFPLFKRKTAKDWKKRVEIAKIDAYIQEFDSAEGAAAQATAISNTWLETERWLVSKANLETPSARQPGVEAMRKAAQIIWEHLRAIKQGINEEAMGDASAGDISTPTPVNVSIVSQDPSNNVVTIVFGDSPHVGKLSDNFKDTFRAKAIKAIDTALYSYVGQADKPNRINSFNFTMDWYLGSLVHAKKKAEADDQYQFAYERLEKQILNDVVPKKFPDETAERIFYEKQDEIHASWKEQMDMELTDEQRKAMDESVVEIKAKVKELGINVFGAVEESIDAIRRNASGTLKGSKADAQEVVNWKAADAFMAEKARKHKNLTLQMLTEVNQKLFQHIDTEKDPGVLRKAMEYSGSTNTIFTMYIHPELVQKEMGELVAWVNEQFQNEDMNPIEVATKAHRWFISIHPFADANGRTSRLLHDYILRRSGLPPAIASKDEFAIFGAKALIQESDPDKFASDVNKMKKNIEGFLNASEPESQPV